MEIYLFILVWCGCGALGAYFTWLAIKFECLRDYSCAPRFEAEDALFVLGLIACGPVSLVLGVRALILRLVR